MHAYDKTLLVVLAGVVIVTGFVIIFNVGSHRRQAQPEAVVDPVTDKIAKRFDPVERSCEQHCLNDKVFYNTPAYHTCMKECADKGGMADQISVDACEVALSALDLHIDREANPLGPTHDPQKDHEGTLRLRKLCQTSSNRLALVRQYLTDERLPFLMEAYAKAARDCSEMAEVCVKYLPQAVQPKQE